MTCSLGKPDCSQCPYSKEHWEMQVTTGGIDWQQQNLCDWPYIGAVKVGEE